MTAGPRVGEEREPLPERDRHTLSHPSSLSTHLSTHRDGRFRRHHPLPQGASRRRRVTAVAWAVALARAASHLRIGGSLPDRVPGKKKPYPVARGSALDAPATGRRPRIERDAFADDAPSFTLAQVEFRGQTAGLKRGKTVKVRGRVARHSRHHPFPLPRNFAETPRARLRTTRPRRGR